MKPLNHFSYHSEQVHSAFANGRGETRRNIVSIKNGKGYKMVETYGSDGKVKTKKRIPLKPNELSCIRRNKFIPGLFKKCIAKTQKRR
jgi:hypothetical protein